MKRLISGNGTRVRPRELDPQSLSSGSDPSEPSAWDGRSSLTISGNAMAIDFRRIVYFGDSLTDSGNLPEPVRPDPPYVGGRLTNGRVYAEVLAQELGLPSDNVAFGGAEASTDSSDNAAQQLINLSAQVDTFLAQQSFPFFGFGGRVEPGTA